VQCTVLIKCPTDISNHSPPHTIHYNKRKITSILRVLVVIPNTAVQVILQRVRRRQADVPGGGKFTNKTTQQKKEKKKKETLYPIYNNSFLAVL